MNQIPASSRDNTQTVHGAVTTTDGTSGAQTIQVADVVDTSRWDWSEIDESLWSASYPYQLAVLSVGDDGQYSEEAVFTLPINPESFTNDMQFATTLQATLGGVNEQNGGVPLRPIVFAGNMGVVNDLSAGEQLGGLMRELGGIAGGTIQAVQQVGSSFTAISGPQFTENLYPEADSATGDPGVPEHSTGYYQVQMLTRFFESYAEGKKSSRGSKLRLALYVWKDQAAWLVTPHSFRVRRTYEKPHEYEYDFACTAWARINPVNIKSRSTVPTSALPPLSASSAGKFKGVLNSLQHARSTLQAVRGVAAAIRSDFDQTVLGSLRQVTLFVKDVSATIKTIADFPRSFADHVASSVSQEWQRLRGAGAELDASVRDAWAQIAGSPAAAQKVLSDPANFKVADSIRIDRLTSMSQQAQQQMNQQLQQVRQLTTQDFKEMRQRIDSFAADYAEQVGLGVSGQQPRRQSTDDDFRILYALYEASEGMSYLCTVRTQPRTSSKLDYVAGLANSVGLRMRAARSKFAVPFPYGMTLERLALQYLGDATRWDEIASLNNLRAPYVDEVGISQALLVNGKGNEVMVADASQLVIGQTVTLRAPLILPEQRQVVAVQKVAPSYWLVRLDGAGDLDRFTTRQVSQLHHYLPGTVNSQKVIFIPSDAAVRNDLALRYVPNLNDLQRLLQVGGVDGALDEQGDIPITPDGDWPYVQGMARLIQWARIGLGTRLNSLPLHPDFGIDVGVGESLADMSARDVLTSIQDLFRKNDAFTGVNSALVQTDGPVTQVTLELGVRGVDALLPVTFPVQQ